jgi:hypothetical protein
MTATPGPYHIEGRTIYARDPDGRHRWNATVDTLRGHRDVTRQELDSVVRLLATSWEMREALRGMLEAFECGPESGVSDCEAIKAVQIARHALAQSGDTP